MAAGGGGWDTTGFTYSSSACTCYPPYCRCREPKPEPVKCPDCGAWFVNEHRCTPFVADTQTNTVIHPYFPPRFRVTC